MRRAVLGHTVKVAAVIDGARWSKPGWKALVLLTYVPLRLGVVWG